MDDRQLQIPGILGPYKRFVVTADYWIGRGWAATIRHKHDGESLMCTAVDRYEGLTTDELAALVDAALYLGGHRFTWDASQRRCVLWANAPREG